MFGVKEVCASLFLKVTDTFFGDAILEMGIDATVGDGLPLQRDICQEGIISKSTIVTVVVQYCETPIFAEGFESTLGLDCFSRGDGLHDMDVR